VRGCFFLIKCCVYYKKTAWAKISIICVFVNGRLPAGQFYGFFRRNLV
jgi:hypothetical protein